MTAKRHDCLLAHTALSNVETITIES